MWGPNETPFDVHVELLCDYSPYFDSFYSDCTKKPIPSDPISFPDEDPDIFAKLLGWIYYGDASVEFPPINGIMFLLKLWVLAGRFQISQLQNHVIRLCRIEMDKKPEAIFGCDKIDYVYTHTLPQSPLRLLLVDNWVRNACYTSFLSRREQLSHPFLEEFCSALVELKERADDTEGTQVTEQRYYTHIRPCKGNVGSNFFETGTIQTLPKGQLRSNSGTERSNARLPVSATHF